MNPSLQNGWLWGAQAASLQLPAALPATSLLAFARIARSRQAAETYRLAACAPQKLQSALLRA